MFVSTQSRVYKKYDKSYLPPNLLRGKIIEKSHNIQSGGAAYSVVLNLKGKWHINDVKCIAKQNNCVFFNEYSLIDRKTDKLNPKDFFYYHNIGTIVHDGVDKESELCDKAKIWPPIRITFCRDEDNNQRYFYVIDRTNYPSREDRRTVNKINKIARNICDIIGN